MKKWIKLETGLLGDERVRRLMSELGAKGFGVYVMLRLVVEASEGMSAGELVGRGATMTSRGLALRIINDYGLFSTNDDGLVCASVRESGRGIGREQEPILFSDENINLKNKSTSLEEYVEEMKREAGEWREVVCMHSGIAPLLMAHWTEAVEQWRQHVVSYDKAKEIFDYSRARYYFCSYVKQTSPSGRALKEYLEGVEMEEKNIRRKENELWE